MNTKEYLQTSIEFKNISWDDLPAQFEGRIPIDILKSPTLFQRAITDDIIDVLMASEYKIFLDILVYYKGRKSKGEMATLPLPIMLVKTYEATGHEMSAMSDVFKYMKQIYRTVLAGDLITISSDKNDAPYSTLQVVSNAVTMSNHISDYKDMAITFQSKKFDKIIYSVRNLPLSPELQFIKWHLDLLSSFKSLKAPVDKVFLIKLNNRDLLDIYFALRYRNYPGFSYMVAFFHEMCYNFPIYSTSDGNSWEAFFRNISSIGKDLEYFLARYDFFGFINKLRDRYNGFSSLQNIMEFYKDLKNIQEETTFVLNREHLTPQILQKDMDIRDMDGEKLDKLYYEYVGVVNQVKLNIDTDEVI